MRRAGCVVGLLLLCACPERAVPQKRAELRRLSGDAIEVIPTPGQMPYCLMFTTSEKGVVRQLTMTRRNASLTCEAGRPIGATSYRIPVEEGKVRIHILFSDQRLDATSIAHDIGEMAGKPDFNPMSLRLPGNVTSETLEFTPETLAEPMLGTKLGPGGETGDRGPTPDAGP